MVSVPKNISAQFNENPSAIAGFGYIWADQHGLVEYFSTNTLIFDQYSARFAITISIKHRKTHA
jgi:hypothetical protein